MYTPDDIKFLKLAIANSQTSFDQGNFPAGAVVVKDGQVLAEAVSSPYPSLFHPDSKAITEAFNKIGPLTTATLYIGLESCLMCTGVAFWAGVRRIVFAVPKSKVSGNYYETALDTHSITNNLSQPIEFIHIPELEEEALAIVKKWEDKYLKK